MTIVEMLGQSGNLALLGMGTVFSFLILMIIAITVAGKIIHAAGMDRDLNVPPAAPKAPAKSGGDVTAAIGAAVNEYRKHQG